MFGVGDQGRDKPIADKDGWRQAFGENSLVAASPNRARIWLYLGPLRGIATNGISVGALPASPCACSTTWRVEIALKAGLACKGQPVGGARAHSATHMLSACAQHVQARINHPDR